ncbi:MAG: zf-HC2 domain-containing protein [Deltaproteobacteria bacterium]|nr:zf-HC2 domain-containing protein [Deltaproteobacteria bacterium]
MRCRRARKLLSAYLDRELEPRRRERLETHLTQCQACAAALEQLSAQSEALADALPAPAVPPALRGRVLAALDARAPWHRRQRARLVQAACVAACAILGFACGALLSWSRAAPADPPAAERALIAEAFDADAFGLSESREGCLQCAPR